MAEAILDGEREQAVALILRIDELVEANRELGEANRQLGERVTALEEQLGRSSRNSSLLPSSDPPGRRAGR